jgi:two-component system, chemotaxis family, response regulator Rcp1
MTMVPVVLVVDDDPNSAALYRQSLEEGQDRPGAAALEVVADGSTAIRRLNDTTAARPDLVILDISMPGRGGHEVLAVMRSAARLFSVPVVVFSSSAAQGDVELSYGLGANCHVVKPADPVHRLEVVRQIQSFWLRVVTLPPTPPLPAGG